MKLVVMNLFIYSMMMFLLYKNYFLLMLMSMEFMVLNMLLLILFNKIMNIYMLYFLVICVCEAVLGLSLLVIYIRFKGNDKMKFMNLILW